MEIAVAHIKKPTFRRRDDREWKNDIMPDNLVHIHGTIDEVFPIKYTKPDHVLRGGHMLVFNQAREVNEILVKVLEECSGQRS